MAGHIHKRSRSSWRVLAALLAALALVAAACGDSDDGEATGDDTEATEATVDEGEGDDEGGVNACPADGCTVTITDVVAEGDELMVTWDANFDPDLTKNHIHIYWDTFTADQVSSDAEARGVEQGDWVPTDAYPEYLTEGAVSVANRGDSTTLCVTAADREHAVIDSGTVDCRDVSDLL